jgi:hypothetical protein
VLPMWGGEMVQVANAHACSEMSQVCNYMSVAGALRQHLDQLPM